MHTQQSSVEHRLCNVQQRETYILNGYLQLRYKNQHLLHVVIIDKITTAGKWQKNEYKKRQHDYSVFGRFSSLSTL